MITIFERISPNIGQRRRHYEGGKTSGHEGPRSDAGQCVRECEGRETATTKRTLANNCRRVRECNGGETTTPSESKFKTDDSRVWDCKGGDTATLFRKEGRKERNLWTYGGQRAARRRTAALSVGLGRSLPQRPTRLSAPHSPTEAIQVAVS